jgi:hypothetical protein
MIKQLHEQLLQALILELRDWKFIKSQRHFIQKIKNTIKYIHLSFINHQDDFDVTVDFAVEHTHKNERVCIVGAELGNIIGTGQYRWSINQNTDINNTSNLIIQKINEVGIPFINKYSNLNEILSRLKSNKEEALLISPIIEQHTDQIAKIEKMITLTRGSS